MTRYDVRSSLGRLIGKEDLRRDLERVLQAVEASTGAGAGITQPEWHVNSVTGKDTNDGAAASTPIRTLAELDARMGIGVVKQPTLVYLSGDFRTELLSVRVSCAFEDNLDLLHPVGIVGIPSVLRSGTLTAVAGQTIGSAVPPAVTDPSVASWAAAGPGGSSLLRKRLRIVSSPGDPDDVGKVMWLKRDDGGGAVSTSWPSKLSDPLANGIGVPGTGGLVTPPYGYVVEELTRVGGVVHSPLTVTRLNVQSIGGPGLGLSTTAQVNGGFFDKMLAFDGCDIEFKAITEGCMVFSGCRVNDLSMFGTIAIMLATLIDGGPIQNSMRQLFIGSNTLSIENNLYVGSLFGSSSSFCGIIAGGASAYDSPGDAVSLEIGSTMHAFGSLLAGTLHGTGNLAGVRVGTNSAFSYDIGKSSIPSITGASEVVVGSTTTTWAAIDAAGGLIETAPPTLARVVIK